MQHEAIKFGEGEGFILWFPSLHLVKSQHLTFASTFHYLEWIPDYNRIWNTPQLYIVCLGPLVIKFIVNNPVPL